MTELIQRLDRQRFDVHVACFHKEGAWLPRVEALRPGHRLSDPRLRASRDARPRRGLRALVPGPSHPRRARVRSVRERVRAAVGGAGRRAGAYRQPPRAQPRQDAGADRAAAPGLPLRSRRRGQLRAPRRSSSSTKAFRSIASTSSRTASTPDAFAPRSAARPVDDRADGRQPAHGEGARSAARRGGAPRAAPPAAQVPDRRRRSALRRAARAVAAARPRAPGAVPRTPRGRAGAARRRRTSSCCRRARKRFPNGAIEAMAAGLPVVASRGRRAARSHRGRPHRPAGAARRCAGAGRGDRVDGPVAGARRRRSAPRRATRSRGAIRSTAWSRRSRTCICSLPVEARARRSSQAAS